MRSAAAGRCEPVFGDQPIRAIGICPWSLIAGKRAAVQSTGWRCSPQDDGCRKGGVTLRVAPTGSVRHAPTIVWHQSDGREGRLRRNDAAGSEPDLDQTASLITGCLWELAASPAPIAVLCL